MSCISFDILDTCLCRTCGEPYAVFDLLAREVLGPGITPSQLADFRYIRTRGEALARKKCIADDVTIEQIYQECVFSGLTDLPNEKLIEKEISIEKRVLRPIYETLQQVKKIHSKKQSVVYISDMYLPSSFFIEILKDFGFWEKGDKIYVSCEIGKAKSTGNLFKYVASDLKISYFNWTHYGDNRHSDVNVPRRLGIFAHHVHHAYSYYQKYLRSKDYEPSECYMSRVAGISLSIILGDKFSYRLQFAADIIAPLYVSFTYNVLSDAQKRGINRLFFMARDTNVVYEIAQKIVSLFPGIEIKYLFASRKALYLPSLDDISIDSLRTILPSSKLEYNDEYFDNLQIDVDGLSYEDFQKGNVPPVLYSKLEKRWEEQKVNTINYFKQEGLADNNSKIGIVDIRGKRNCQRFINKILAVNNYSIVYGYYLEADRLRILPEKSDEYKAFYFGDHQKSPNFTNLSLSGILLEKYFCLSTAKRTSGYDVQENGIVKPQFEEGESLPQYYDVIGDINKKICLKYCQEFINNNLGCWSYDIFNYSLSVVSDFFRSPKIEYVKVLEGIEYTESKYHSKKMVSFLSPSVLIKRNIMWLRGSLVITHPLLLTLYDRSLKLLNNVKSLI